MQTIDNNAVEIIDNDTNKNKENILSLTKVEYSQELKYF